MEGKGVKKEHRRTEVIFVRQHLLRFFLLHSSLHATLSVARYQMYGRQTVEQRHLFSRRLEREHFG